MPSNDFELAIIRPVSSVNIRVRWVEVQGTAGNFLVGPDHSPLTALLKHKGDLIYQTTDGITKTVLASKCLKVAAGAGSV